MHLTMTDCQMNRLEQQIVEGPTEDHKQRGPEAQVSVARFISDQDMGKEALDPREYQIQLFARAKNQ